MNYKKRHLETHLAELIKSFPALWLSGPRQSGKTTLIQKTFPDYQYVSLEDLDQRHFAIEDPRGFLRQYPKKVILDEIQKAPQLLSYLQTHIDKNYENGQFILTSSHQFQMAQNISQSLAGRVAIVYLHPFSLSELFECPPSKIDDIQSCESNFLPSSVTLEKTLYRGLFPAVHDRKSHPTTWYSSYYATYLERDVREITNIQNLQTFDTFVRLCAARSGYTINFSELSNSCGMSVPALKSWVSILELSGIIKMVYPYFKNYSKRLIKTPKLYFLDSGLLCYLLRIADPEQLIFHPLKGNIFESFIVSELIKSFCHRGLEAPIYYWRDNKGREIDIIIDLGHTQWPVEIKLSETIHSSFFNVITWWLDLPANPATKGTVIYGGETDQARRPINIRSWRRMF